MATPAHTTHAWRFGVYEVDAQREELRRAGVPIKLREQSFRVLVSLLEKPGELVTREDLRKALWPADTFVDFDHSLNTAVMKLREALGDTADKPLYIETVPKRGYKFIAPVLKDDAVDAKSSSPTIQAREEHEGRQSIAFPAGGASRRRLRYAMIAAAGLVALTILGFLVFSRWLHPPVASRRNEKRLLATMPSVPITQGPGSAYGPAISPDGKWIAYVWNGPERKNFDIYVQLLGSATPLRLTMSKGLNRPSWPKWSPDGTEIAFSQCNGATGGVFVVPAVGGVVRELTTRECWQEPADVAWFPNGKEILMGDRCSNTGLSSLVVFSVETGKRRCVMGADDPFFVNGIVFFNNGIEYFTLSPDGKTIVFAAPTDGKCCDLYMIPASGGRARQLTFDQRMYPRNIFCVRCLELMWTADSQSIIASAYPGLPRRVPVNGGAIEDESRYPAMGTLSPDGRRLFYTEFTNIEFPAIWRADLSTAGGSVVQNRRLDYAQQDLDPIPSPDGSKLAWSSFRSEYYEIWTGSSNGGRPFQLTHVEQRAGSPNWSPDGRWVVFDMWDPRLSTSQIYVVDAEGKNLHAITGGPYTSVVPSWSQDGKWIYFVSYRPEGREVWKHSLENGTEVQLTHHGGFDPHESYDGRTVYFTRFQEPGLWSVPSNGGRESVVISDQPRFGLWGNWALTRDGIYYGDFEAEPRPTIMYYQFATRSVKPVLVLQEQMPAWMHALGATADGKTIFYNQWAVESVIKMIELPQ